MRDPETQTVEITRDRLIFWAVAPLLKFADHSPSTSGSGQQSARKKRKNQAQVINKKELIIINILLRRNKGGQGSKTSKGVS